ncbi:MAG: glutathione S-transferase N-terminal domain-containing protein [Litoreibacter sp.]|uniref:glutathione S-transferase family protein n=1 Tax=Litoreibacter sp. TaxID=1969459 RepID=UPI0032972A11
MKPKLKLWGRATSYNVQKVAWIVEELGLECSRMDAGGAFGGLDDPEYIAMNPNKRVPTLVDGDQVLWESNAICRYLARAYDAQSALAHETLIADAQADMWMEWFQNNVYTNSIALFHQTVKLPPSQRSASTREAVLDGLTNALRIFDAALSGRKFILGDQLSLGDIPTGSFLYRYFTLEIERPPLPNLERYYDELKTRQAYKDAVMVDYSSLRGLD